jgi:two-component system chemotaxis response regulator CheB
VKKTAQRLKVLIVDDDQAIREELSTALGQDPALDIGLADDGKVALHQIANEQFWPHVILLDLMMPHLDGDEFLAALDAIKGTREIALVAMTAMPPSRVPESVRSRARSILFKPFSVELVVAAIRATLEH